MGGTRADGQTATAPASGEVQVAGKFGLARLLGPGPSPEVSERANSEEAVTRIGSQQRGARMNDSLLEARIGKLEREVRRWRVAFAIVGAVILASSLVTPVYAMESYLHIIG